MRMGLEGGHSQIFFCDGNTRDGNLANFGNEKVLVRSSTYENSTFTCFHCGTVEHVQPKADVNAVGFCRNCLKPICQACSALPCVPFEEKLRMIERKVAFDRNLAEFSRGMWT